MAISYLCGFEMGSTGECSSIIGVPSIQTSVVRSGIYAARMAAGDILSFSSRPAGGGTRSLFFTLRVWIRIAALPSADAIIVTRSSSITLKTTGAITLIDATSSRTLSADNLWHCLEWDISGTESVLYIDGEEWARSTTAPAASGALDISNNGAGGDIYFDDLLVCDTSLASSNGYSRAGRVLKLLPTADPGALNSWTNGGGGTTSIFEGVNNIPPVGAAASTDGTKIKNAANGGSLDYVATMQTYLAAGVPVGSKINAVMAICNDGEEVATNTKAGGIWVASNPAQAAGGNSFDYGNDAGALGTFPANWATHCGPVTSNPAVTLATAPTVTVRKTSSTTRVVDVDFLGMYVDYTPPMPLSVISQPTQAHYHQIIQV